MANRALKAVSSNEIQIIPDSYVKIWNEWLENSQDW
jgi:valyl-tRNA synthetase